MKNIEKILGSPNEFLEKIFENLERDGIDVSDYELDHICYRVETLERYNFLKEELLDAGELLSENVISGRKIAVIKVKEPIVFQNRKIDLIELPQPKDGSFFKEGFEHVEFVINQSFDYFIEKYKNVDFKKDGMIKEVNADIIRKYDNVAVKFHHYSLEYVVKYLQK